MPSPDSLAGLHVLVMVCPLSPVLQVELWATMNRNSLWANGCAYKRGTSCLLSLSPLLTGSLVWQDHLVNADGSLAPAPHLHLNIHSLIHPLV